MIIHDFAKHPESQYTKEVDLTEWLPSGATIVDLDLISVKDIDTGEDALSVIGTPAYTPLSLLIPVQGGVDGSNYLISFKATLSNGNILADDQIMMRCRNIPS